MRVKRPLFLVPAALLATLFVVLVLVPWLFRHRIARRIKLAVNESVSAHMDWESTSVDLWHDFPNVTISLNGLSVATPAPFAGDTLVRIDGAQLSLDLSSVIGYWQRGAPLVIRRIVLDQPDLRLRVLADGRSNWDITRHKGAAKDTTTAAVAITLRSLTIRGGHVTFSDAQSQLEARVSGLRETLRGDFASKRFVLSSNTHADSVTFHFAGIPYLQRTSFDLAADIDADMTTRRFAFARDTLRLNRLALAFDGAVTLAPSGAALDVRFAAPGTRFADILSLVPAIYARDFASLRTDGTMAVSGRVNGTYGPGRFPAFSLAAQVRDGAFKHPSLPLAARGITLDLGVTNPGGSADATTIDLERFHAQIGARPVDARLVLRTPISDPDVDLRLLGSVDLADVARLVPMDAQAGLKGIVNADLAMRARVSDATQRRYDRISAAGRLDVSRLAVSSATIGKPLAVDTMAIAFTPRTAELRSMSARIGGSDVNATGTMDNLLGFMLHNEELRGRATVRSRQFLLDEWKSKNKNTTVIPVPPRVDFTLAAFAGTVQYGALALRDVQGTMRVKDRRVTVSDLRTTALGGNIVATGWYDTADSTKPAFDMGLRFGGVQIPEAFAALTTVQKLAPIARWAQGALTGSMTMRGRLGPDMVPLFASLAGSGNLITDKLAVSNSPVLGKLADALKIEAVRSPALGAVHVVYDVDDGRVQVQPFTVNAAGVAMTVGGSNGIDQTLAYDLSIGVPRTLLGGAAGGVVSRLAAAAGQRDSAAGPAVRLAARVTGTVTNPVVSVDFAGMAASATEALRGATTQAITSSAAAVKHTADSIADVARQRAEAEMQKAMAEAQARADTIRAAARALAASTKRESRDRADSLVARASNPVARMAARAAADRALRESDSRADALVAAADARADSLLAAVKRRASP